MPANSSPTAQAARLHAARGGVNGASGHSATPLNPGRPVVSGERCCEWPRRAPSNPPFSGIRQALQAIQARHA